MADELGITNTATPPTQPATPETTPAPAPQPAADPVQEATRLGGSLGGAAVGALQSAAQHKNTPMPAPPTVQSTGKTVRMVNPAGQVGEVPEEKASDAAKSGYKTVVQMTNPKGEVGNVPVEKSHDALTAGYKFGAPIKDQSSVSAAPNVTGGDVASAIFSPSKELGNSSLNKVTKAVDDAILNIESYTPKGREEHPVLAQVGDMFRAAKNLLLGGAADSANPFALRMSNAGLLNNPAVQVGLMAMGTDPEAIAAGKGGLADTAAGVEEGAGRLAGRAKSAIGDVMEDWFKPTDVPKPQHGTPVSVESPFDRATINNLQGGKDLSPQAFDVLQKHVGDTIPVGSSPKNTLMKAVEPVQKTIAETGVKMAKAVDSAPAFKTSIMDDSNAVGPFVAKSAPGASIREGWQGRDFMNTLSNETETGILKDIRDIREGLPLKADDLLNKAVDTQFRAAEDALNSTDPREILRYRQKLGQQIKWAKIDWGPDTAGEVANTTKVKIYHALGNKLKTEIPEVAELDKVFSPNLELRGHMDEKLGTAISRDPAEATSQQLSEHAKGKAALESVAHNTKVKRNLAIAKGALATAGIGAAGTLGVKIGERVMEP